MPAQDQLEIIDPQGRIRFYPLDSAKGITNIGRHIDNDIVINRPGVAAFHAMIDHRNRPITLIVLAQREKTVLDNEPAPVNLPMPLTSWASIEIGGHQIIYLTGDAPAEPAASPTTDGEASPDSQPAGSETALVIPVVSTPPPAVTPIPPDPMAAVTVEYSSRSLAINPGETTTLDVTIANGGYKPLLFQIAFSGLDPTWFQVTPDQIEVPARQRNTVSIIINPPHQSDSHAANYTTVVTVTTPNFEDWKNQQRVAVTLNPFSEFGLTELAPRVQSLSPNKAFALASFEVSNRGNSPTSFRLTAEDERYACRYEFKLPNDPLYQPKQAELRLSPGETGSVQVRVTPSTRHRLGWGARTHYYTVTASPQANVASAQLPRSVLGQVREQPLIGPLIILVFLAAILTGLAFAFRPTIAVFSAVPAHVSAGEEVVLTWSASSISDLRINPDVGRVDGPDGRLTISPTHDTVYVLIAENFLTWLNPNWFRATREITVLVDPVLPSILFTTDRDTISAGESINLSWQVANAEQLILNINGRPEAIPPAQFTSSRTIELTQDTLFVLRAVNPYTTDEGVTATITVRVAAGTPVPQETAASQPAPVIDRFEISPEQITQGQQTTIFWSVTGVDKVLIDPLPGEFPPSGNIVVSPQQTTAYTLTATSGDTPVKLVRQVIVNPAPGAPVITSFTATPNEVLPGSPESRAVKLAWVVTGETTDIQISGPGLSPATNLSQQGELTVAVDVNSTFTLTATNGVLASTQTVDVRVNSPVPSLVNVSPATIQMGSPGASLTIIGGNFISSSVVQWNGSPRPTTYVSPTQLLASLTSADLATAGTANVTVSNPAPGGGTSNPVIFTINNPAPVISSITPNSAVAGGSAFALPINGSGFNSQTLVRWNGSNRTVSSVSPNQLTVLISAADIAAAGSATVSVVNPVPGGGSDATVFTINAPTATPTPTSTPTETPTPTPTPTATATP